MLKHYNSVLVWGKFGRGDPHSPTPRNFALLKDGAYRRLKTQGRRGSLVRFPGRSLWTRSDFTRKQKLVLYHLQSPFGLQAHIFSLTFHTRKLEQLLIRNRRLRFSHSTSLGANKKEADLILPRGKSEPRTAPLYSKTFG